MVNGRTHTEKNATQGNWLPISTQETSVKALMSILHRQPQDCQTHLKTRAGFSGFVDFPSTSLSTSRRKQAKSQPRFPFQPAAKESYRQEYMSIYFINTLEFPVYPLNIKKIFLKSLHDYIGYL